jgi:membrane protein involved in colicin uptake
MGHLMRRFRFAPLLDADTGGGGAGDGGEPAGADGSQGGTPNAGGKITFTPEQQAAIDAIIAERVSRANKAAGKTALEARAKELGFDTVEAMETALQAHKEATDKQKTDLEKAQEAKAAAEAKATKALAQANQRLVDAEARVQATGLGVKAERIAHVIKLADLSQAQVSDDGAVDGDAVKAAIEAVLKDVPELRGAPATPGGTGGNPPRGGAGSGEGGDKGKSGSFIDRILERQGLKKPEEQKSNYFS